MNRLWYKLFKRSNGFTLVEILVALFLVTIILMAVVGVGSFSSRSVLDETLEKMERAIRFSADEAALRNAIIRVHFYLDKRPQEYAVEFGPNDSFVLPKLDYGSSSSISLEDQEKKSIKIKKLNRNFNKVREFQDKNYQIDESVRIIGIGTSLTEDFVTDAEVAIYIYPTGEKDHAFIVLATEEETATLSIDPFILNFDREYALLGTDITEEELDEIQTAKGEELFKAWYKK